MRIVVALLMIWLPAAAYGQLVRCVSKDGKVAYARDCPAGTTEHQTGIRSSGGGTGAGPAAPQKSLAERDAEFKKQMNERLAAEQKEAQQAEIASRNREACELAQSQLKLLESGSRLPRVDPRTGETTYASDEEREADTVKARAKVAENCKVAK